MIVLPIVTKELQQKIVAFRCVEWFDCLAFSFNVFKEIEISSGGYKNSTRGPDLEFYQHSSLDEVVHMLR